VSAAARPVDLVLHIGTGKTGTTSIQTFLHRNRDRLAGRGVLYPRSPGMERHTRVSLSLLPDHLLTRTSSWPRQSAASPAELRETFQRELVAEIAQSGLGRVVLSDEALYGAPLGALRRLRELTERLARSVRVVVYLRRQDDHLISRYQQVVKVGETRRLAERVKALDLSDLYDYRKRLGVWQRVVEPTSLVVRRFERASFVDGSLHQDFLDAAGVDVGADELEQVTELNESLDAESVEFLRLFNLFRVQNEGARVGQIDNRSYVERLWKASGDPPGPTLTLPPALLDEFMATWEESNAAVAAEFLDDPSGQLFRTPRKSDNLTSDQVLDPTRLDRYLEVLELPAELHAPLRALAESEAAAR
jgi:hypothetical protein